MKRQLPSPDKLYDLLINRNMSYVDVGMTYGIREVNVVSTFKRDCRNRGIEWPVPRQETHSELIRKAMNKHYLIDTFVIKEIIEEFLGDTGWTMRQLAVRAGLEYKTISRVLSGKSERMKVPNVQKLFKAMGEEMPDSLAHWQSRSQSNEDTRRSAKPVTKRKSHDDILDEWQFLRECGWTNMSKIANKIGVSYSSLEMLIRRYKEDPRVGSLKYVERYTRTVLDAA